MGIDASLSAGIRAVARALSTPRLGLGRRVRQAMTRALPVREIEVRGIRLKAALPFHQVGTWNEFARWDVREPDCLDWIDGFKAPFCFLDVGAGFGTESLYAGRKYPDSIVVACDAELLSSYNLAVNIALNGATNVRNLCTAIGASRDWIQLRENVNYLYPLGDEKYVGVTKTLRLEPADGLPLERPVNYMKIDVDGQEMAVLTGAEQTLKNPEFRSLFLEIDDPEDRPPVFDYLTSLGLRQVASGNARPNNFRFERP